MRRIAAIVSVTVAILAIAIAFVWQLELKSPVDPFRAAYEANCSACHRERLEGTPRGTPLVGVDLKHGDSVADIRHSCDAFPEWRHNVIVGSLKAAPRWTAENRPLIDRAKPATTSG